MIQKIKSTYYFFSFLILWLFLIPLVCHANDTNNKTLYDYNETKNKKNDSLINNFKSTDNSKNHSIPNGRIGLNPSKQQLVAPYNSSQNVNPVVGISIVIGFMIFAIYIGFRVRNLLRKEREKDKKK